jgi:VanZ family protein
MPPEDIQDPVSRYHRELFDRMQAPFVAAIALLVGSALPLPARHNPDFGLFGPDKALHATGHMALTATLLSAVETSGEGSTIRAVLAAIIVSSVYGVGTELLQKRVPGREFESGDLLAGLLGSVCGALCWYWTKSR